MLPGHALSIAFFSLQMRLLRPDSFGADPAWTVARHVDKLRDMPHYEDQCSDMFPFTSWAPQVLGDARAAQMRERAILRHTGSVGQLTVGALLAAAEQRGEYVWVLAFCTRPCIRVLCGIVLSPTPCSETPLHGLEGVM